MTLTAYPVYTSQRLSRRQGLTDYLSGDLDINVLKDYWGVFVSFPSYFCGLLNYFAVFGSQQERLWVRCMVAHILVCHRCLNKV